MTPAMTKCLSAYRVLSNGRAPTMPEMVSMLGIREQSVARTLDKLRLAGFPVPLSRAENCRGRTPKVAVEVPEVQKVMAHMLRVIRTAGRLVDRKVSPGDWQWRQWVLDAGRYLSEV